MLETSQYRLHWNGLAHTLYSFIVHTYFIGTIVKDKLNRVGVAVGLLICMQPYGCKAVVTRDFNRKIDESGNGSSFLSPYRSDLITLLLNAHLCIINESVSRYLTQNIGMCYLQMMTFLSVNVNIKTILKNLGLCIYVIRDDLYTV